jgi:hypothetical protein
MTMTDAPYYVYIYRDPVSGEIRYVGKGTYREGASKQRVEHHVHSARNAEFRQWVGRLAARQLVPTIELFPCTSEEQAFRVEGALISALWQDPATRSGGGLFNKVRGHHGRFVPIGLPDRLADRHYKPPLTRNDLADLGGALTVYVSSNDFQSEFDDRRGAFPHYDLTDDDVRERILGWWQIGKHLDHWRENSSAAPALLVAVTGPPARRWVWGAVRVTRAEWAAAEWQKGGLYRIPANSKPVDARHLRGRLVQAGQFGAIGEDGNRRFGGITAQIFDVVLCR